MITSFQFLNLLLQLIVWPPQQFTPHFFLCWSYPLFVLHSTSLVQVPIGLMKLQIRINWQHSFTHLFQQATCHLRECLSLTFVQVFSDLPSMNLHSHLLFSLFIICYHSISVLEFSDLGSQFDLLLGFLNLLKDFFSRIFYLQIQFW